MNVDYLIVGSGLTGAVIARTLADLNRDVLVVDRRPHMGGNVHDHTHESGIKIHTYGPHYFRTSSDRIWEWVNRFSEFNFFAARIGSVVDNEIERWPLAASYVNKRVGLDWTPSFTGSPTNFEEAALSLMPSEIYTDFVKEYNEKQWGVKCTELDADLCKRFDVRDTDESRLTPNAKHQGLPKHGYSAMTQEIFRGIPLLLNFDYLKRRNEIKAKKALIFTGPIDEFFNFEYGRLNYRGQKREHTYHPDADFVQRREQLNNPQHKGGDHIRTIEWKHLMEPMLANKIRGSVTTTETPYSPTNPSDYEYPFPSKANRNLYQQYRSRVDSMDRLFVAGRLGEYRYYDMDQAIGRAMTIAEKVMKV